MTPNLTTLAAHLSRQIKTSLDKGRARWQIAYALDGWAELYATETWDGTVADESRGLSTVLEGITRRIASEGADAKSTPLTVGELRALRAFGISAGVLHGAPA